MTNSTNTSKLQHHFTFPFVLLLLLTFQSACHSPATGSDAVSADQKALEQKSHLADTSFYQFADSFINAYLDWRPQTAVALGFHQYDGKLTDYSKASLEKEHQRLINAKARLSKLDTASMSKQAFYRLRILRHGILTELFSFDDMDAYRKNPMTYASLIDVNIYIKRNFADNKSRVNSIIALESMAPSLIQTAEANLYDSLPLPYVQTAIEVAKGSIGFLKGDLVIALKELTKDDKALYQSFTKANGSAIDALTDYVKYLEVKKLPKANLHYPIGKAAYSRMLYAVEGVTTDPDTLLAQGLSALHHEQEIFKAAAHAIDPTKPAIEVYHQMQKEHPTAANLIPDAKKNLEAVRNFLIEKKVVTLPSAVRVNVDESPQYLRAVSSASMDTPGPFETKATEAYYYITPVEAKWTPKQQEDWLAQFDYYTTDNVTIHEAYPGHYMQFLHLNASKAGKIEKIFGSYAFIEGWAHYCEVMMADLGYGDPTKKDKYRLAQSGDALLRLCRFCVAIQTHCHQMTVDQATKFFMDNWYQGEKPSRQEAMRGTFDPQYLFYTLGKWEILALRKDYEKQQGSNFSLQKFHDEVLDNGMPPIYLLREKMIK